MTFDKGSLILLDYTARIKDNGEIFPDKGFGERDTSKVRMIPQRKLGEKANEIKVGDVVELDDRTGIVRYIGSGRVQIDYNHRLASRVLVYDVNVVKKIESNEDKIKYLLKRRLPLDDEKAKIEHNDDTVLIELPEDISLLDGLQIIKKAVTTDIFKFVDGLNKITFQEVYLSQKAKDSSSSPSSSTTTTTNETVTSDTSPRSDSSLRSETASKSENKTE